MGALICLLAFGVFYLYLLENNPSSRDVDDVHDAASAIKYPFFDSKGGQFENTDGHPSLYLRPHPRRSEIIIYGVLDQQQQNEIITMITRGQEKVPNKPVLVTFLEREVWERDFGVSENGSQHRGKEKTIRSLTIKRQEK